MDQTAITNNYSFGLRPLGNTCFELLEIWFFKGLGTGKGEECSFSRGVANTHSARSAGRQASSHAICQAAQVSEITSEVTRCCQWLQLPDVTHPARSASPNGQQTEPALQHQGGQRARKTTIIAHHHHPHHHHL